MAQMVNEVLTLNLVLSRTEVSKLLGLQIGVKHFASVLYECL